jgi:hypothetical protein
VFRVSNGDLYPRYPIPCDRYRVRVIEPENFRDEADPEAAYELARRRVGLPARPEFETLPVIDPMTELCVLAENFKNSKNILEADGSIAFELDDVAFERARRRIGLPWRRVYKPVPRTVEGSGLRQQPLPPREELDERKVFVKHLRKEVPEQQLSRIVPGTNCRRMTRLQQYTLFGPAGQPMPCCWKALFGVCTASSRCRLCDHGAVVPPSWVSQARRVQRQPESEEQRTRAVSEKPAMRAAEEAEGGKERTRTRDDEVARWSHAGPVPLWPFLAPGYRFRVPTLELVRSNLQDRTSRHIMLLTHNAAALALLFDCGLLRELEVDVLFGSRFPDDVSELQLVQQVNRVKMAMAAGRTIVLVNHDNIYEALYDVLNQRYLIKRDPRTGETRRLLRLAIGSRSQLCICHDNFKVVVIVEMQHAHERLDLPLLNRFEKQELAPTHALVPAQERLCARLREWVHAVAAELGLLETALLEKATAVQRRCALGSIFCGWHEGMLASLALQLPADESEVETSDDNSNSSSIVAGRAALLRIAKPIAVFHSAQLRGLPEGSMYFEDHQSLLTAARRYFWPGSAEHLFLLLTHSPVPHCDEVLSHADESIRFTLTQLTRFGSEEALGAAVDAFLAGDDIPTARVYGGGAVTGASPSAHVLLIQYDPVDSEPGMLEHAMYIVQRRHALHPASTLPASSTASAATRRFVTLVVHLPPGTSRTPRHVALEFSRRWAFVFVDDLRVDVPRLRRDWAASGDMEMIGGVEVGDALVSALTLPQLLGRSLYELLADGGEHGLDLQPLIRAEVRAALGCTLPPIQQLDRDEVALRHSYAARVKGVGALLREVPEFARCVADGVLAVLSKFAMSDAHGMHLQAVHAKAMGGTCRDAVRTATRRLLTRSLAHVLAALDENFNLNLLQRFSEPAQQHAAAGASAAASEACASGAALWHALAGCPALLDWHTVARSIQRSIQLRVEQGAELSRSIQRSIQLRVEQGAELSRSIQRSMQLRVEQGAELSRPTAIRRGVAGTVEKVHNTGKHGPLVALFPFSARLVRLLESKEVREAVAAAGHCGDGEGGADERMTALISSVLGTEASARIRDFAAVRPEAYLHDLVASTAERLAGLTFASQLRLCALVVHAHAGGPVRSPGAAHALLWANERRLHHAARLLGGMEQEGISSSALEALERLSRELDASFAASGGQGGGGGGGKGGSGGNGGGGVGSAALAQIDLGVARAVVDAAWQRTSIAIRGRPTTEATIEAWRAALSWARHISADVVTLLDIGATAAAAASSASARRSMASKAVLGPSPQASETTARELRLVSVQWRALTVVHLFALEVLLASDGAQDGAHADGGSLERLAEAARGLCLRRDEWLAESKTSVRALLQAAAAAAAPVDPNHARLGSFIFALTRDVLLRAALAGEFAPVEGVDVLYSNLMDVVAGTTDWLPPLPRPARELLLHALRGASLRVPALAEALSGLCARGVGGSVLILRHEERLLKNAVSDVADQPEFVKALSLAKEELQVSVRLSDSAAERPACKCSLRRSLPTGTPRRRLRQGECRSGAQGAQQHP